MSHARPPAPYALEQADGVVLVEFLMAFLPLLLLFCAITQLALIAAAGLVVQHAAVAGVRAAAVVLDDDPRFYAGAARGSLVAIGDDTSDRAWSQRFTRGFGAAHNASAEPPAYRDGPRMDAIRSAVHARIAAIVPDTGIMRLLLDPSAPSGLGRALGRTPLGRLAFGLSWYAPLSTAVSLPIAPGSDELAQGSFNPRTTITVRVTHAFACLVPIVASLLCSPLQWDARAGRPAVAGRGARRAALRELGTAPLASQQWLLARAGIPVWILRSEASLPAQTAAYRYASERSGSTRP